MVTVLNREDRCPYIITKSVEDESYSLCEFNDKPCLREAGLQCDIYDEWLKEQQDA